VFADCNAGPWPACPRARRPPTRPRSRAPRSCAPSQGGSTRQAGTLRLACTLTTRLGHDPETAGASGASRRCQTRARRSWLLTTPSASARCSPGTGHRPFHPSGKRTDHGADRDVLHAAHLDGIWGFHQRPAPGGWTRVVVRTRSRGRPRLFTRPFGLLVGEPVHFFMQTPPVPQPAHPGRCAGVTWARQWQMP
jgi:hypothetical protein